MSLLSTTNMQTKKFNEIVNTSFTSTKSEVKESTQESTSEKQTQTLPTRCENCYQYPPLLGPKPSKMPTSPGYNPSQLSSFSGNYSYRSGLSLRKRYPYKSIHGGFDSLNWRAKDAGCQTETDFDDKENIDPNLYGAVALVDQNHLYNLAATEFLATHACQAIDAITTTNNNSTILLKENKSLQEEIQKLKENNAELEGKVRVNVNLKKKVEELEKKNGKLESKYRAV